MDLYGIVVIVSRSLSGLANAFVYPAHFLFRILPRNVERLFLLLFFLISTAHILEHWLIIFRIRFLFLNIQGFALLLSLFWMLFVIGIDHILFDKRKNIILNQIRAESRIPENIEQQQHCNADIKMNKQQQESQSKAEDLHQGNEQVTFQTYKSKNESIFVNLLDGQLEGNDHHAHVVLGKGENNADGADKGKHDIIHDTGAFRPLLRRNEKRRAKEIEVKNQQGGQHQIDDTNGQRLLPVFLDGIEEITYDDFTKLQFQVGEIISCEAVEKSKKLLCSQVRVGSEVKQIVSGIRKYYTPEEMVGKKVMVLVNLKPAKLAGVLSEGMLLCAEDAEGNLALMTPEKPMPAGAEIC